MKKILITGGTGQIGWELIRALAPLGKIIAPTRQECDLSSQESIIACLNRHQPTLIINTAACTAVDVAEKDPAMAMSVNALAPKVLASEAKRLNAPLIHFSTDYLFDGTGKTPYKEEDATNPLNVYGTTKLAGEKNILESGCKHIILRTSWVYGLRGTNFLLNMLKKAKENTPISLVSDQIGAPTWCRLIAEATGQIIVQLESKTEIPPFGVYNLTAAGSTSRNRFAEAIFDIKKIKTPIQAIKSEQFPTPAKRPLYCILSNDKIKKHFGIQLPNWEEQLKLCLEAS